MTWQQLDDLPVGTYVEGRKEHVWLTFRKLDDGTWEEFESKQIWTKYQVAALSNVDIIK